MKKITKLLFLPILIALFGAFTPLIGGNTAKAADATSITPFPKNGYSGDILFVNGGGNFVNEDLAVYFYNNSESAWSERVSYRVSGDLMPVAIPYKNGVSKTWTYCIICSYYKDKNPEYDGWDGRKAQTDDIYLPSMIGANNTITITGSDEGTLSRAETYSTNNFYGISSGIHMYLDLSSFTAWENDYAKFAIYFAKSKGYNNEAWSISNSPDGYYTSFCWKVQGQDNDHLYECIVPGTNCVWNLVIPVRIDSAATVPNWDQKWDQTNDIKFVKTTHNANMIRVTDWHSANLDADNVISRASRVSFYGNYFLNTVSCSGTGASDATTSDMWNAVQYEYKYHLQEDYQGDIWLSKGDKDGTTIEQAMARYDYIVLYKQYDHYDFINRKASPNKTEYSSLVTPIENNIDKQQVWPVAIVAFVIAMGGLSTLLIIKVRKNKRQ